VSIPFGVRKIFLSPLLEKYIYLLEVGYPIRDRDCRSHLFFEIYRSGNPGSILRKVTIHKLK